MNFSLFWLIIIQLIALSLQKSPWSIIKAQQWYSSNPWILGCNFIPSTAVNVLEMFQNDTFDPKTISQELSYASSLGFNTIRVFLHYLLWQQSPKTFKEKLETLLFMAHSHKIKTMFVLFDDCWKPEAYLGPQPAPIPSIHNSQWVQCPGQKAVTNETLFPIYEAYVKDLLLSFKNDQRVLIWDLYNEPGNSGHKNETFPLLTKVFSWARETQPSQPLTAGLWNYDNDFTDLNTLQLKESDIITFHKYDSIENFESLVSWFEKKAQGRPFFCSEYMARPLQSTFVSHLPVMKEKKIGGINWGLVAGKTQTIYPWWSKEGDPAPNVWFHDIFSKDGKAFDVNEVEFIRNITKGSGVLNKIE